MGKDAVFEWQYSVVGLVLGVLAPCAKIFSWGLIIEFVGVAVVAVSAVIWIFTAVTVIMDTSFSRQFVFTSSVLVGWVLVKLITIM